MSIRLLYLSLRIMFPVEAGKRVTSSMDYEFEDFGFQFETIDPFLYI